eukprot:CAMPEP_0113317124 /NCGR_PEP_ID=MMETSP0010_2-20120614/12140_1 /TAXON_ID=216773 ORGANISM="Corethron hystrix, Strain 308" /NCGR_SAMPLE_ID=MMETSP0010_2 /ASSEMBLY_ACC=CAM_ASM_000155 /LENGTH=383 /DNA_ID=CAMNT_0000174007 /DNA_START=367 /DNA_END=1518 /DNA_ORIENTATION=- /assembly_acc=CAM_ASM_000155
MKDETGTILGWLEESFVRDFIEDIVVGTVLILHNASIALFESSETGPSDHSLGHDFKSQNGKKNYETVPGYNYDFVGHGRNIDRILLVGKQSVLSIFSPRVPKLIDYELNELKEGRRRAFEIMLRGDTDLTNLVPEKNENMQTNTSSNRRKAKKQLQPVAPTNIVVKSKKNKENSIALKKQIDQTKQASERSSGILAYAEVHAEEKKVGSEKKNQQKNTSLNDSQILSNAQGCNFKKCEGVDRNEDMVSIDQKGKHLAQKNNVEESIERTQDGCNSDKQKRSASPKRSKISPGELYDMKTVDGNVVHQTNSIWDHIGDDDFCTDDSERSVNLSPNVKTRTSGNESKQTLNCGLTKAQHSMSTSIFCGMEGGDFIGLSDEDNDD